MGAYAAPAGTDICIGAPTCPSNPGYAGYRPTTFMYSSGFMAEVATGDIPDGCRGEFQFVLTVAGELPGVISSLSEGCEEGCPGGRPAIIGMLVGADMEPVERPEGSEGGSKAEPGCDDFLRWERCFSSIESRPSFVKGFGRTSFMPVMC